LIKVSIAFLATNFSTPSFVIRITIVSAIGKGLFLVIAIKYPVHIGIFWQFHFGEENVKINSTAAICRIIFLVAIAATVCWSQIFDYCLKNLVVNQGLQERLAEVTTIPSVQVVFSIVR